MFLGNESESLTHRGEPDSDGSRFPNMFKHLGLAVASDVVSDLKVAERACITGRKIQNHLYIDAVECFSVSALRTR